MICSIFLCIFVIPIFCAQTNMPDSLKDISRRSSDEDKFWGMPKNHPIRMELERDPGIPIGRMEDFDIAAIRKGDIRGLSKGRMESISRNPAEIFFRKPSSLIHPQCNIEIQQIQSFPGQCIRLGDGTPACKSDHYVAINNKQCY